MYMNTKMCCYFILQQLTSCKRAKFDNNIQQCKPQAQPLVLLYQKVNFSMQIMCMAIK